MGSLESSADSLTIPFNSGLSYKTEKQQKAQSPRFLDKMERCLTTKKKVTHHSDEQETIRSDSFSKTKAPYNCKIL